MVQEPTIRIPITCPYCGEKMVLKVGPPTNRPPAVSQIECLACERELEVDPPRPILDGPFPA